MKISEMKIASIFFGGWSWGQKKLMWKRIFRGNVSFPLIKLNIYGFHVLAHTFTPSIDAFVTRKQIYCHTFTFTTIPEKTERRMFKKMLRKIFYCVSRIWKTPVDIARALHELIWTQKNFYVLRMLIYVIYCNRPDAL